MALVGDRRRDIERRGWNRDFFPEVESPIGFLHIVEDGAKFEGSAGGKFQLGASW